MTGKWHSKEEKLSILSEFDQGNASLKKVAKKYGIHTETRTWYDIAALRARNVLNTISSPLRN
ncbi:hypothetical protein MOF25_06965 [Bacillus atrophaeus]|uniref:hypothetical protein n=1 Tax=Bacillus atrophaeus TaxID=1452 RepID=UPI00227E57C7|nr:hypothetical protein [Bacillus atrophaeus]MCY9160074.1 hypothetical protein [Bacillus atrophaeus]